MMVAHQTDKQGQPGAGIEVYDVADPAHPKKLAYFDTSGPHSRGVHYLWFADGHYAYLTTGAKDFTPKNKLDDQFFMVVDMQRPRPSEGGRPLVAARHPRRRQGPAAAARLDRFRHPHAHAHRLRRNGQIEPMSAGSTAAG